MQKMTLAALMSMVGKEILTPYMYANMPSRAAGLSPLSVTSAACAS